MKNQLNRTITHRAHRRRRLLIMVEKQRRQDEGTLRVPGPPRCLREQQNGVICRDGEER